MVMCDESEAESITFDPLGILEIMKGSKALDIGVYEKAKRLLIKILDYTEEAFDNMVGVMGDKE
jgi:hypothetical protein